MNDQRSYYLVEEGGFVDLAIKDYQKKYKNAESKWFEFAERHGGTRIYAGISLAGVVFDSDQPPSSWIREKKVKPEKCFRPARRKACMAAYKEFKSMPHKPEGFWFAKKLDIGIEFTGATAHLPSFEHVGSSVILSLHKDSKVPDGVKKLKMSEYWALKESVEVEGR